MKAGLSLIGAFLAAGILVGGNCGASSCVQFDAQSLRARHDEARDRLDLLLIYRDLTACGEPAKAVDQLEEIRDRSDTLALLDNFPISFSEEHFGQQARASSRALWTLLTHDVDVTAGALWRDERGRLCGNQLVRIAHVSGVLEAANAAILEAFRSQLEHLQRTPPPPRPAARTPTLDDWLTIERLQRCVTAGEDGYAFLSLRGPTIVFSMPVAGDDVAELRRAVVATVRHDLDTHPADASWHDLDVLARNRIALDQVGEELQVVLGDPAAAELQIESPPRGLEGKDLGEVLAARGWSVGGTGGEAQALAGFEAFCAER